MLSSRLDRGLFRERAVDSRLSGWGLGGLLSRGTASLLLGVRNGTLDDGLHIHVLLHLFLYELRSLLADLVLLGLQLVALLLHLLDLLLDFILGFCRLLG